MKAPVFSRVLLLVWSLFQSLQAGPFLNGGFESPIVPAEYSNDLAPRDTWVTGWVAGPQPNPPLRYGVGLLHGGLQYINDFIAPAQGDQCLFFDANWTTVGSSIGQKFTTQLGKTYVVEFSLTTTSKIDTWGQMLRVKAVSDNGFVIAAETYRPVFLKWSRFAFSFPAFSDVTDLIFETISTTTTGEYMLFDDVTVTADSQIRLPAIVAQTHWNIPATSAVTITNYVATANPPVTFYPSASFPVGAYVTPEGVFKWTTSRENASSTNTITVWAVDANSQSNSMTYNIVVQQRFELLLAPSPVEAGQLATFPLSFFASVPVTSFWFGIPFPSDLLANWSIVPNNTTGLTATVKNFENYAQVHIEGKPGQVFQGLVNIGTLTADTNPDLSFVSLVHADVVYYKDMEGFWRDAWATTGKFPRVVAVGSHPIFELRTDSIDAPTLFLFAQPGTYDVLSATSLSSPSWTLVTSVVVTNLSNTIPLDLQQGTAQFFKAVRR